MQAQLDTVNGQPVLRLEQRRNNTFGGGKRTVYDLKLTPEQAKAVDVYMLGEAK